MTFTDVYAARAVGTPDGHAAPPEPALRVASPRFLIFLFLLWLAPRKRFHGQVTLAYVALYSAVRFVLEFFRGDPDRGAWLRRHASPPPRSSPSSCCSGVAVLLPAPHRGKRRHAPPTA